MKKRLLSLALVLFVSIPLSGCLGRKMYKPKEADRIVDKTSEVIQAWIDHNLPEATLGTCTAYDILTTDFKRYLTDFGQGFIYTSDGNLIRFTVNTVSGEIYFDRNIERLNSAAQKYFCEVMGFTPKNGEESYFSCISMVPISSEESNRVIPGIEYLYVDGIPEPMTVPEFDMDAYVRNPKYRQKLCLAKANLVVSDDIDLSRYNLSVMEQLGEKCGMQIGSLVVKNKNQYFKMQTPKYDDFLAPDYAEQTGTSFRETGILLEGECFRICGQIRERIESVDADTNQQTVTDRQFEPTKDFVFEKTETGYRYINRIEEWDYTFTVLADEGAEILKHDYIFYPVPDDRYEEFIVGKYDVRFNMDVGIKTAWEKQEDGTYRLVSADNASCLPSSRAGFLEQLPPKIPVG